ncbi:hypothetical protein [Microbacterium sp. 2RAF4]|uniref:hypothetical protein n=1 Tax=Microbacterium sp. 2RAF4 TaxID=3232999 RepID=UPI003F9B38D5
MNNINTEDLFVDGLPAPKPRTKKIHNRSIYLTTPCIGSAKQNPGVPVRLAQGKLVDKAYAPTLKAQAIELGSNLKIDWVYQEDREIESATTGKITNAQMGWVFLTYTGDPISGEDEAPAEVVSIEQAVAKAEKKARKKAKRQAAAEQAAA